MGSSSKSSILSLIAKVTYATKGIIETQRRIAPLIEIEAGFHMDLTGRENIYINGIIVGMGLREIEQKIPQIIEFSEPDNFIGMPAKKYSSAIYLRLAF